MNSVNLIGRLVRDPEIKYTPGGTAVCDFTLAVDRAGDKQPDETYAAGFFDVTVFGKIAENCSQYLVKGQQAGVSGSLRHHRWESKEGEKRSKVELIAFQVKFLEKASGQGRPEFDPGPDPTVADDDIPF